MGRVLVYFHLTFAVFDPALIGLALTYTISLTGMFQYTVRQSAEVENIVSLCQNISISVFIFVQYNIQSHHNF